MQLQDAAKFGEVTEEISQMTDNRLVIWMDYQEGEDSFEEEVTKEDPKFVSAPAVSRDSF